MWRSCGEATQPPVARLPTCGEVTLAGSGEVTKSVARLPVARLPCGEVTLIQSVINNAMQLKTKKTKQCFF